jgi:hypothetical protein
MKTAHWIVLVLASFSTAGAFGEGKVKVSFRPAKISGKYAPRHVVAVWVADAKGGFVKTLAVYGLKEKKRLKTWAAQSKRNETDAVTGATLKRYQKHTVVWDCRDAGGDVVPDGDYRILVEYTCANQQGPVMPKAALQFTKGSKSIKLEPDDIEYFEDIKLTYKP